MFNFATIPNVSEATLREMAFMFAYGNTFDTIGKHFNLDPNLCRMIAVNNWDQWKHYFEHAHELYRTEQTFLLVVQAITMMNQTTEPKGFVALLRVVLNFFRIPFNRPKKVAPPRPTTPAPQPAPPPDDFEDDYDDDDDWDIPDEIVNATRELVAQVEATRTATTQPPANVAPTVPFTEADMQRFVDVVRAEPTTYSQTLQRTDPALYAKLVAYNLVEVAEVPTESSPTLRQRLQQWFQRFGRTAHPPDQ